MILSDQAVALGPQEVFALLVALGGKPLPVGSLHSPTFDKERYEFFQKCGASEVVIHLMGFLDRTNASLRGDDHYHA